MISTVAKAYQERADLQPMRWEIAGAFGDIGILFPIAIALISLCHVNPTAIFLTAGISYILAGAYFRIPISVQPFKAVAAIALALHLAPSSIASAGVLMGVLLALVGLTNLVTPLARLFSLPIVRGIQLGLGLILLREGIRLSLGWNSGLVLSGGVSVPAWMLALGAAAVLVTCQGSRRVPAALVLLGGAIVLGLVAHWGQLGSLEWGPVPLQILHPRFDEFRTVLTLLVLPQFALTFGNSIVATENTAQLLYGREADRVTARALSISIALMNLIGGTITSAPCCHGSGGITAHYKFGARTPRANYVVGAVCLLLALFGRDAVTVLGFIPTAVLGVFLIYVGLQHAALVRDVLNAPAPLTIAVCVGLVSVATTNLSYGFVAGFLLRGTMALFAKVRAATTQTPVQA